MGPAALLDYDRSRLRGLVLEEGGPTSHIAIVARALGIPAVGEVANATAADGDRRRDHRRRRARATSRSARAPEVEAAYAEKARLRARRQEQYRKLRDVPAVTRDGVAISLQLNAGLLVDLPHLEETGAAGIGLFRTELQFMIAERMPTAGEQQALYAQVFAAGRGPARDVPDPRYRRRQDPALHAVDRGGEPGPRLAGHPHRPRPAGAPAHADPGPAQGGERPSRSRSCSRWWRPATSSSGPRPSWSARRRISPATAIRCPPTSQLGAMLEVPSLLFQIREICAAADFISVGSNDLMQFLFAIDRENRRVADRFDPLSAPMLRALTIVAETAAGLRLPRDGLRRDRRAAAGGHGAHRPRLPLPVDVAGLHRPREGHAARDSTRPRSARSSVRSSTRSGAAIRCVRSLPRFAENPWYSALMSLAPPTDRLDAILARHDIVTATLNAAPDGDTIVALSRELVRARGRGRRRSAPTGPWRRTSRAFRRWLEDPDSGDAGSRP